MISQPSVIAVYPTMLSENYGLMAVRGDGRVAWPI